MLKTMFFTQHGCLISLLHHLSAVKPLANNLMRRDARTAGFDVTCGSEVNEVCVVCDGVFGGEGGDTKVDCSLNWEGLEVNIGVFFASKTRSAGGGQRPSLVRLTRLDFRFQVLQALDKFFK